MGLFWIGFVFMFEYEPLNYVSVLRKLGKETKWTITMESTRSTRPKHPPNRRTTFLNFEIEAQQNQEGGNRQMDSCAQKKKNSHQGRETLRKRYGCRI